MRRLQAVVLVTILLLSTASAQAATVVARSDEAMTKAARAIAVGTVLDATPRYDDRGNIETVVRFLVDEAIKGEVEAGSIVELVQFGGALDGNFQVQSGAPTYRAGDRYLVFLDTNRAGRWTTFDLALGQFRFRFEDGMEMLQRDTGAIGGWWESGRPFRDGNRLAGRFLQYVRDVAKEQAAEANYWVGGAPDSGTAPAVVVTPAPAAIDFDVRGVTEDSVAEWKTGASAMNDSVSATPASGNTKLLTDCESRVIPDDPNGDISGSFGGSGVVATAFFGCSSGCGGCDSHSFNGQTFIELSNGDIVIQDGVSSSNFSAGSFATTMVHELGHTWGFRHSNKTADNSANCTSPALPCTTDAIMNSSVVGGLNGNLRPWDDDAANETYGDGTQQASYNGTHYVIPLGGSPARRPNNFSWRIVDSTCAGPTINSQPPNRTIGGGQSASLSVSATSSSGSLSYQWYTGTTGNTSSPVGGATTSSINVSPASTTLYWVRVTDQCGDGDNTEDSNNATVTVACNPAISSQPSNKSITSGGSTSLSVSSSQATTFQWYQVSSACSPCSDTSNPVGTNSSSFNTGTLTTGEYYYWVRASTNCGSTNSNSAKVTVSSGCTAPGITTEPADVAIASGATATLTVLASGTGLSYQWYQGAKPSTTTPVGTDSSVFVTPALTADTKYWVRVSNSCGTKDSRTATVDVVSCTLPTFTSVTSDTTVSSGATVTLSVTGSNFTSVTWYRGLLGDESQSIGTGASITSPAITETTTFWAKLTNTCGSVSSTLVTITVAAQCAAPVITVEPLSQKVMKNATVNLSVLATGSAPLTFQWYEGSAGVTTKPVGGNSTLYTTGPITKTVKYWVLVTNSCGTDQSSTATISIPKRRAARH